LFIQADSKQTWKYGTLKYIGIFVFTNTVSLANQQRKTFRSAFAVAGVEKVKQGRIATVLEFIASTLKERA